VFKERTGMGFREYKLKVRVSQARRLLAESSDTVEKISCSLGYRNPESFIRMFKRATGLTPAVYRDRKSRKSVGRGLRQKGWRDKEQS
jgi:transcriptional regulator GlxA family with amidase domain